MRAFFTEPLSDSIVKLQRVYCCSNYKTIHHFKISYDFWIQKGSFKLHAGSFRVQIWLFRLFLSQLSFKAISFLVIFEAFNIPVSNHIYNFCVLSQSNAILRVSHSLVVPQKYKCSQYFHKHIWHSAACKMLSCDFLRYQYFTLPLAYPWNTLATKQDSYFIQFLWNH
jgi:hypothetical protein